MIERQLKKKRPDGANNLRRRKGKLKLYFRNKVVVNGEESTSITNKLYALNVIVKFNRHSEQTRVLPNHNFDWGKKNFAISKTSGAENPL